MRAAGRRSMLSAVGTSGFDARAEARRAAVIEGIRFLHSPAPVRRSLAAQGGRGMNVAVVGRHDIGGAWGDGTHFDGIADRPWSCRERRGRSPTIDGPPTRQPAGSSRGRHFASGRPLGAARAACVDVPASCEAGGA